VALSLKLAEAEFMRAETGEWPVLLLDDILSELDAERRRHVLSGLLEADQLLITATDLTDFPPEFLNRAARFRVEAGQLSREA
jgi:DNA replication and repair protein RecF